MNIEEDYEFAHYLFLQVYQITVVLYVVSVIFYFFIKVQQSLRLKYFFFVAGSFLVGPSSESRQKGFAKVCK